MYVNKEGHCISCDGDVCIDCIHDGYNECRFHKAISNYVNNYKNFIDIRIDECEEYQDNADEPGVDWWD